MLPVKVQWVTINGELMLAISLPQHQHVLIDRDTGWRLLLEMRYAMREPGPGQQLPGYPG